MSYTSAFLQRVLNKLPKNRISSYKFESWSHADKPTKEGVGLLPIMADPDKLVSCIMNVNGYVGNLEYVEECRAIADNRFVPPERVRFYQRVRIPMLGSIHHELVLTDASEIGDYRVVFWEMLEAETVALSAKVGFRSQYNEGAWLIGKGCVGYALSSAPRREDVGFIKWKALTAGADMSASPVVKANIDAMTRWAAKI
jgi:hypothetical protein